MKNKKINLNTAANAIAGNRVGGPVGNTAAEPGLGTGNRGRASISTLTTPATSRKVDRLGTPAGSSPDHSHHENQDSNPNRGEFGVQDLGGTTHGGFGNQNRQADYKPHNSAEDQYYGGPGRAGHQANAYRAYDGRNERPITQPPPGLEFGIAPPAPSPAASTGTSPAPHAVPVDEPADSGYARDYGQTALSGAATAPPDAALLPKHRNQTGNYQPAEAENDS